MTSTSRISRALSWLRGLRWRRVVAIGAVAAVAVLGCGFAAAHFVPLPDRLQDGDSLVATYSDGRPAHALLSDDDKWRLPTQLNGVDSAYIDALLALEDRRFYAHPGVDPIAVVRAAIDNLRSGSAVSGASTITMQLVRLLEPRPRTLRSKFVEALRAVQLEVHMSKDEILEAYLRFVPYGGNVEGIEAATLSFWDKSPTGLTSAEIATLLAIPQSPEARRPAAGNRDALRTARDDIAWRLAADGAIPLAGRSDALRQQLDDTDVPDETGRLPRDIPHLVRWLSDRRTAEFEREEAGRSEPSVRIETSLHRDIQRRTSEIAASHAERLRSTGAPHATVVVMESDTGAVRGVVGNLDFDSSVAGSQLSAFAQPRSTGSVLKPVVYAAALDDGIVAPTHQLQDAPMVRGDYRPQNFDRRFRGLVEAERSLSMSYNIPFVRLLERLGVDDFVQTMVRFELEGPARRAGDGGLELVVGGMPATALEIASLYAGLARLGRPVEPRLLKTDGNGERADGSAVTPAAAWLTARALTRRSRPWTEVGSRRARDEGYAWKTGTSMAYHDAWTAGFGDDYTVAVWAGDLAYQRHPQLIGSRVAAPLFFDIMEAIDEPFGLRAQRPAGELADIEVCSRSGRRPGPHCEHRTTTEVPATTAAPERCDIHDVVDVDADTGRRLPEGCRPDGVTDIEQRVVERMPTSVARLQRARGRRAGTIPEVHPDCRAEEGAQLAISSPRPGSTVVLEEDRPADRQKLRLEAYSSTASEIHWYIDGRHLESAGPDDAVFWTPQPGEFTITAVDGAGERDARQLPVEGRAAPQ